MQYNNLNATQYNTIYIYIQQNNNIIKLKLTKKRIAIQHNDHKIQYNTTQYITSIIQYLTLQFNAILSNETITIHYSTIMQN